VNYRTRCAALKREMKTVKFGVVVMCVEVCWGVVGWEYRKFVVWRYVYVN
jgi:hypothetical protein